MFGADEPPGESGQGPDSTLAWRLIVDPPRSGALNMALDEALARRLESDQAVFRLYSWSCPTISLGRNEPTRQTSPSEVDIPLVRRPTGGRAVLHEAEVTYAVVVPARSLGGARATYSAVNRALARGPEALGAPVRLAAAREGAQALPPEAGPCFDVPAPGEIVAGGRKLVGSAQVRFDDVLLQHGSILLTGTQAGLGVLSSGAAGGPDPMTLGELVEDVDFDSVAMALASAMEHSFGSTWSRGTYTKDEMEAARALVEEKYSTPEWTWRR